MCEARAMHLNTLKFWSQRPLKYSETSANEWPC
jgi:hypothetical protein